MTDEEVKHYDGKWKRLDTEIAILRAEVDRLTEINADAAIRLDDRLLRAEKAEAALADERELVEQLMDADPSTRDWVAKARALRAAK